MSTKKHLPAHAKAKRRPRRRGEINHVQCRILLLLLGLGAANTVQLRLWLGREDLGPHLRDLGERKLVTQHHQRSLEGGRWPSVWSITKRGCREALSLESQSPSLGSDLLGPGVRPPETRNGFAPSATPDEHSRHRMKATSLALDLAHELNRVDDVTVVSIWAEAPLAPRVRINGKTMAMADCNDMDRHLNSTGFFLVHEVEYTPPNGGTRVSGELPWIRPDMTLALDVHGRRRYVLVEYANTQRPGQMRRKFDAYALFAYWGRHALQAEFTVLFVADKPPYPYARASARRLAVAVMARDAQDEYGIRWRFRRFPFLFADRGAVTNHVAHAYKPESFALTKGTNVAAVLGNDPEREGLDRVEYVGLLETLLTPEHRQRL